MPTEACAACSKSLVEGGDFCPFCGTRRVSLSTTAAIDRHVHNKVNLELSTRLKDQSSLVREIGDKAEDVVWKRLTRYGVMASALLACILGFIGFEGFKTLDDVKKRIEPVVSAAEQRAQAAKRTSEDTGAKVDLVKGSVDRLAVQVDTQTKRVAERGGEISEKLNRLDAAANEAQKRGEIYQARSEELSRQLEATAKALEKRVEQVSKQVDDLSGRRAYPNFGEQPYVTFEGDRWKGKAGKGPEERWLNISIDSSTLPEISREQLEKLMAELKRSNFTPLLGSFGVRGPFNSDVGSFGTVRKRPCFTSRRTQSRWQPPFVP
jgi:hypothetical protein